MAKEVKDNIRIIKESERVPELEEHVRYFMENTPSFPENKVKFKRVKYPVFENDKDRVAWEREEVRRCKYGYKGMCGKMYFYFNYCWIQNLKMGKIAPEFRVADNEWFKKITEVQFSEEWGFICVKRRRAGASWKEAADIIHDVSFNKYFHVGINSKSERDSEILFKKVIFIYENLPEFLKVKIGSKAGMKIDFFRWVKDELGQKKKAGNQSNLIVVPPTDSAYEGMMLNKWVCDEAGKIRNLPQMWSYTEDCLMQETVRAGCPVLFGTSGEIGKEGAGLMRMWENSETYKLKRFFFAGYMGIMVDEYGNDLKEEAIRYIIYERHRRSKLDAKTYNDFIQKYPLTPDEAFRQAAGDGVGDIALINNQLANLRKDPPVISKGYFRMDEEFNVEFIPSKFGKVLIYEHPNKNDEYLAGCDPADHDDVTEEASDMSLHIMKRKNGLEPPLMVMEFVDRPAKASDYYNQALAACLYYNKCKVLIERNRYRMISHFDDHGFKYLLATTPQGVTSLIGGRKNQIGIHVQDTEIEYMNGLIEEYIENYHDLIWSKELLQECVDYGTRNTDRVSSFGLVLMLMKEYKLRPKTKRAQNKNIPRFSYKRVNGKIIRVNQN